MTDATFRDLQRGGLTHILNIGEDPLIWLPDAFQKILHGNDGCRERNCRAAGNDTMPVSLREERSYSK